MSKDQLIREVMKTDLVHEWTIALRIAESSKTPCIILDELFEIWAKKVPATGKTHVGLFANILRNKNISRELHTKIVNSNVCDIEDGEVTMVLTSSPMISTNMMEYLSKHDNSVVRWSMAQRKDLSSEVVNRLLEDPDEDVRYMCKMTYYPELSEDPNLAEIYQEALDEERQFIE